MGLITSYSISRAVCAVAELGLADALSIGSKSLPELAHECGIGVDDLRALVRALSTIGMFKLEEGELVSLTPLSQMLVSSAPDSLCSFAKFHGECMYVAFGQLVRGMRSQESAWHLAFKLDIWKSIQERPTLSTDFLRSMGQAGADGTSGLILKRSFSNCRNVIDIGGGAGHTAKLLAEMHEHLDVCVMDNSSVEGAEQSRVRFLKGDFFERIPPNADVYILQHVLHDWSDEKSLKILRNCREAMGNGSRLLIAEQLLEEVVMDRRVEWSNLSMRVIGGRERTSKEYIELFSGADLCVCSQHFGHGRAVLFELSVAPT